VYCHCHAQEGTLSLSPIAIHRTEIFSDGKKCRAEMGLAPNFDPPTLSRLNFNQRFWTFQ